MTAEEFYNKIIASPELEQALEDATDNGTLAAFLSSNGCTATEEEFTACIASHS